MCSCTCTFLCTHIVEKFSSDNLQKKERKYLIELKEEIKKTTRSKIKIFQCCQLSSARNEGPGFGYTKPELKAILNFLRGKNEKAENCQLPLGVQIGVTAACAGIFLLFVPIPGAAVLGQELLYFGFGCLDRSSDDWAGKAEKGYFFTILAHPCFSILSLATTVQ